jgi:hypothetical protein
MLVVMCLMFIYIATTSINMLQNVGPLSTSYSIGQECCIVARQRHFPDVRTATCPNPPVNHDSMITAPALTPHRPVFLYSFPESGFSTVQLVNEGYGGVYEVATCEEGEIFLQRGRAAGVPKLLVHLARP